jgi:hypothetical protein
VLQKMIDTLRNDGFSFVRMDKCLAYIREPFAN